MKKLTSPKVIKELLKEYEFKFSKSLGQNFLIDESVLGKITSAAFLQEDDYVLEIGAGFGTLTGALLSKAKKVVTIEIDKTVIPVLQENLKDFNNLEIINEDFLKIDIKKLIKDEFFAKPIKVVANLPYYVTTPIIMSLLENKIDASVMVFLVQKEVAQRFLAKPGNKDYGAITLAIDYYCEGEIVANVAPSAFMPQPKVTSSIIKLTPRKTPKVIVKDEGVFFKTIKAAFSQRRKTLLNALSNYGGFKISKENIEKILTDLEISPNRRGETLSIYEFAILSDKLNQFF